MKQQILFILYMLAVFALAAFIGSRTSDSDMGGADDSEQPLEHCSLR